MDVYQVLKRPLITEKMTGLQALGKYAFEVHPRANRIQVKGAVEKNFKVRVKRVNVMTVHGERRRMRHGWVEGTTWKKAIVTLQEGFKIQLFEGV
jgi:large subunit ribosomal protein L23